MGRIYEIINKKVGQITSITTLHEGKKKIDGDSAEKPSNQK